MPNLFFNSKLMYDFKRGILSELLSCWYLDIEFLEKLSTNFEIDFDIENLKKERWYNIPNINDLIYFIYDKVKDKFLSDKSFEIKKIIRKKKLPKDVDYEIFTNCIDSSLYFKDDDINSLYEKWENQFYN
jgi:hypothetical protein